MILEAQLGGPPTIDAVVPAAGLGTRLLPATRAIPKEMLAVVDRPVLQYVVGELAEAGVRRILIVTAARKPGIEAHFRAGSDAGRIRGPSLHFAHQDQPRGLGDAILCAEAFAAGRPVAVALGDAIVVPAGIVSRLLEIHHACRAAATVAVTTVAAEEVDRYGIVVPAAREGRVMEVADVVEKPAPGAAPSRLAIASRYVIGPEVFEALASARPGPGRELGLSEALASVARAGGRVVAVPLAARERRYDIGTVEGYCRAFVELALSHPEWGPGLRARVAELLDERR